MLKVPYASAVESLMYTMVCTRPDLAHCVGVVIELVGDPHPSILALSTTEAELVVAVESTKEAVYLKALLNDLGFEQPSVHTFCDNQSAIHLATNLAFSSRTKHINVCDAYLARLHEEKIVYLKKVLTDNNVVDIFTKSLPPAKVKIYNRTTINYNHKTNIGTLIPY
ncbi:hypothetical protein OSB04_031719 [Centaurea solstitialis]|uniref:Uncharacterized protein n=1 Tax=Centaurea solstitialis TaxID=347529 RepID=A0AA38W8D2_9ASTR|nr:hypothetical protein OSB04_031719 [Centaurea solstitialis]